MARMNRDFRHGSVDRCAASQPGGLTPGFVDSQTVIRSCPVHYAMPHFKEVELKQPGGSYGCKSGNCNARKTDSENRFLGYCELPVGWGTDREYGRCTYHEHGKGRPSVDPETMKGNNHAARSDGGAAPEGNDRAATHGMHVKASTFYERTASDTEREMIDVYYTDFLELYRSRHGEPIEPYKDKMFGIAVSIVKEKHAEKWAEERPDETDSGNVLIDREVRLTEEGREVTYKKSVALEGKSALSREQKTWLKQLELLPESGEEKAAGSAADEWRSFLQELRSKRGSDTPSDENGDGDPDPDAGPDADPRPDQLE